MSTPNQKQKLVDDDSHLRASYKRITLEPGGKDILKLLADWADEANRLSKKEMDNPTKAVLYLQQAASFERVIERIAVMTL